MSEHDPGDVLTDAHEEQIPVLADGLEKLAKQHGSIELLQTHGQDYGEQGEMHLVTFRSKDELRFAVFVNGDIEAQGLIGK